MLQTQQVHFSFSFSEQPLKDRRGKKGGEKKNYSLYHSSIAHLRLTKLEISQKEKRGKKSKTGNIL